MSEEKESTEKDEKNNWERKEIKDVTMKIQLEFEEIKRFHINVYEQQTVNK